MPIVVQNQDVDANMSFIEGVFSIEFSDPSFVRCDKILVDMSQRSIGVIMHEGYHHIGPLPESIRESDLSGLRKAFLRGILAGGHEYKMKVPLELS